MKTHVLLDWEDESDLHVIGVSSHLADYKLAYTVNKHSSYFLKNTSKSMLVLNKNQTGSFYNVFKSNSSKNTAALYLVKNQSFYTISCSVSNDLFGNEINYSQYLIKSLHKWPFLVLSDEQIDWSWVKLIQKQAYISYYQPIDFNIVNKKEQSILRSILYD